MESQTAYGTLGRRVGLAAAATVGLLKSSMPCLHAQEPAQASVNGNVSGQIMWFDVQKSMVVLKTASPDASAGVKEKPISFVIGDHVHIVKQGPLKLGDEVQVQYIVRREQRIASSIVAAPRPHMRAQAAEEWRSQRGEIGTAASGFRGCRCCSWDGSADSSKPVMFQRRPGAIGAAP